MNNLASYYRKTGYSKLAIKYYLMAIKHGSISAMNHLACHYDHNENNYELAKEYYLMAINHGNIHALYNLGHYYVINEGSYEKQFRLFYEYNDMVSRKELMKSIVKMFKSSVSDETLELFMKIKFNDDDNIPYIIRAFQKVLNKNIDLLHLHFQYAPSSVGEQKAKQHFLRLL